MYMFKQLNFDWKAARRDNRPRCGANEPVPLHQKGRRPSRSTPFLVGRYKAQRLFVDLAGADGSLLAVGGVEQTLAQANVLGGDLD